MNDEMGQYCKPVVEHRIKLIFHNGRVAYWNRNKCPLGSTGLTKVVLMRFRTGCIHQSIIRSSVRLNVQQLKVKRRISTKFDFNFREYWPHIIRLVYMKSKMVLSVSSKIKQNNRIKNVHVSIKTRLGAGRLGFYSRQMRRFFATASRPALEPTPSPTQWVPGSFPGIKRPESKANHSPPSSAEVMNAWG